MEFYVWSDFTKFSFTYFKIKPVTVKSINNHGKVKKTFHYDTIEEARKNWVELLKQGWKFSENK